MTDSYYSSLRSCILCNSVHAGLGAAWWSTRQERWHENTRNCPWRAIDFLGTSYLFEE